MSDDLKAMILSLRSDVLDLRDDVMALRSTIAKMAKLSSQQLMDADQSHKYTADADQENTPESRDLDANTGDVDQENA
jgi:hypothetical protein